MVKKKKANWGCRHQVDVTFKAFPWMLRAGSQVLTEPVSP